MKTAYNNTHWHARVFGRLDLTWREIGLLLFAGVLCVLAIAGPQVMQDSNYHAFADQRTAWGLPCVMDVLSNVPFLVFGLMGLAATRQSPLCAASPVWRDLCNLFFYGFIIVFVCSSAYHLHADNASLWLDRMGMSVAFAGMLGMAAYNRVSERAGRVTSYVVLIAAPISLWVWQTSGSLLPWGVVQLGGMLAVLVLAFAPAAQGQPRLPLFAVIGWYALAKALELGDYQVYAWTGELISGHSLKHIASALSAIPVIIMLRHSYHRICSPSVGEHLK